MTCTASRHTYADYSHGRCRCPAGREAYRLRRKRLREGRLPPALVDTTGTRRRIHGLMALGWTKKHIADTAGLVDATRVSQICTTTHVLASTDAAVRRAAAILGATVGPSNLTRRRAAKLGYVSLWAWDDDNIDDPSARSAGALRPLRRGGRAIERRAAA